MTRDGSLESKSPLDRLIDLAVSVPSKPQAVAKPEISMSEKNEKQVRSLTWPNNELISAHVDYIQPKIDALEGRIAISIDHEFRDSHFVPIADFEAAYQKARRLVSGKRITFELLSLSVQATVKNALTEMDRKGLRPAFYVELLGFARKYHDDILERNFAIVALGSRMLSVGDESKFAYIWTNGGTRCLELTTAKKIARMDCQFLAVRE